MLEQLIEILDRLDALLTRFPDDFWARGLDTAETGVLDLRGRHRHDAGRDQRPTGDIYDDGNLTIQSDMHLRGRMIAQKLRGCGGVFSSF
jgi:hypothetical protein